MQLHCRGFFLIERGGERERETKQIKIGGTLSSDGKTYAVDNQIDKKDKIETQIHDKTFKFDG